MQKSSEKGIVTTIKNTDITVRSTEQIPESSSNWD
jgi:hypothetical protein